MPKKKWELLLEIFLYSNKKSVIKKIFNTNVFALVSESKGRVYTYKPHAYKHFFFEGN